MRMGVGSRSPQARAARRRRARIAALLSEPAGARFVCCDLQVHTPHDQRFEPRGEPSDAVARAELAETYLRAARERGVEVVGITEHDDVSWIDELRTAAKKVGIQLLPGFEVESREGVHVLCLFDAGTTVPDLLRALGRIGAVPPSAHGQRSPLARPAPFLELIETIQRDHGGICIAAHVESEKGLLRAVHGEARARLWRADELLAVQLAEPPHVGGHRHSSTLRNNRPGYRRERLPAYLLTSDSRSPATIGQPSTWIKLDEVSVAGLRQAFLDPESRIAYEDPGAARRGPRLLAAAWEGGFLDGAGLSFSPEMTCLIGPNGSGKSAALETIRYALELDHWTPGSKRTAGTLCPAVLADGATVTVAVETGDSGGDRYLVERRLDEPPTVRELDGAARPDLSPRDLLRPRLFGQHEIAALGGGPHSQRRLIESFGRANGGGSDRQRRREAAERIEAALGGTVLIAPSVGPAGIEISLDVSTNGTRDYRPLDELSTAQRSRAILSILLAAAGDEPPGPLIVDQPEDGLDGATVHELAVTRLRELKRTRQVVVATHDPQIPPLCDAEQIVALEPGRRSGRTVGTVRAQGALEREDVRAAARDVLEAGRAPYALRRTKYGA